MNPEKAVRRYAKNTEWAVPHCINGSKNIQKSRFQKLKPWPWLKSKNAKEISLAWGGKYNIKKSNGYLLKGIRERVELISRLSKEHSIKLLCKVLKVARSTYYSILNHKASSREIENNILKSKIFKIYCDNRKVYGCIKITRILREDGYPKLSVNRVSRLMKQLGIRSITIRKFKNYRNKQNEHSELKNLVNQNFSAQKPNQIWLSDIT